MCVPGPLPCRAPAAGAGRGPTGSPDIPLSSILLRAPVTVSGSDFSFMFWRFLPVTMNVLMTSELEEQAASRVSYGWSRNAPGLAHQETGPQAA